MSRIENLLGKFPSDALLDLLTENDILRGKISLKHARARNHEAYRAEICERILGALKAKMHLTERDGEIHHEKLSEGGTFVLRFAFKFFASLEIHPHYEDKIVAILHEELRPIALQGRIVGLRHVFTMEHGQFVIRPRRPHSIPVERQPLVA